MENVIPKIKYLYDPVDYYGKTWIAVSLSREDFEDILKNPEKINDSEMADLSEHFGEALLGFDWHETLKIITENRLENYKKRKVEEMIETPLR